MTKSNLYTSEDVLKAAYSGILNREPDQAGLEAYLQALATEEVALADIFRLFCGLNEAFDRLVPKNRWYAIARLYCPTEYPSIGNPCIWNDVEFNLVFFHIPKTGGTSINNYLYKKFHPLQLGYSPYRIDNGSFKYGQHQRLFSWHMDWAMFEKIPRPVKSLVFLRNPQDRLLSLYNFFRSIKTAEPPFDKAVIAALSNTSSDFFDSKNPAIINVVNNPVVRLFTNAFVDSSGIDPLKEHGDELLALAVSRVRSLDCAVYLDAINNPNLPQESITNFFNFTQRIFGEGCNLADLCVLNKSKSLFTIHDLKSTDITSNCFLDNLLIEQIFY